MPRTMPLATGRFSDQSTRRATRRLFWLVTAILATPVGVADAQSAASTDPGVSRQLTPDDWRADVRQFRVEVLERDSSFSEHARLEAIERLDILEKGLSALSDAEVAAELARIAALSGNAHTRLDPLRNRGDWRRYPVRLWKFSDGWRVIATRPDHVALLGAQVVAIGDTSIDQAEAAVRPLFAGNDGWAAYMASYSLTAAEALSASGLASSDQVTMRVLASSGEQVAALFPEPRENRSRPEENWWHLAPTHPRLSGWIQASDHVPLVLREPQLGYVHADCAGSTSYIRLNRTADQTGRPSLQSWGETLVEQLKQAPPDHLIVDLRFNTGGDLSKALPFIAGLIDSPTGRRGALTVLINGQTFSAGITQAAWLRQYSNARFFGEPVGDEMTFWAEGDNVVLAHSRLTARYATGGHHYLATQPPERMRDNLFFRLQAPRLGPDDLKPWSWRDYREGRDTALDAIAPNLTCGPFN